MKSYNKNIGYLEGYIIWKVILNISTILGKIHNDLTSLAEKKENKTV